MKKSLIVIAVLATAMMAQSAVINWDVATRLEDSSPNGYPYSGNTYANSGTDLYLIYNGVSGTGFAGLCWDLTDARLEFGTDGTGAAFSFADTYTTTGDGPGTDFYNGTVALQSLSGIDLTTFSPNPADWNNFDYSFTILAISDTDSDFVNGAYFGAYTADISGFSELTGIAGTASIGANILDAGANALSVVPEPATVGLFGLGALSAWIIRRNKLKAEKEEV